MYFCFRYTTMSPGGHGMAICNHNLVFTGLLEELKKLSFSIFNFICYFTFFYRKCVTLECIWMVFKSLHIVEAFLCSINHLSL